jgi:DNA-binding response OmpR family regulator
VLLVEDDAIDQLAFKRSVREQGSPYEYEVAGSVAEARDLLSRNRYDAVITDYALGDGTAFDVIELARGIPLVFTTGAGDEEVAVRAMKSGADDYLVKDHERAYLKKLPLTIEGHTSSEGKREKNMELSKARAESVKAYFVSKGIEASRITAVGYGPDKPVADNATEEGRAKNRRVEVVKK